MDNRKIGNFIASLRKKQNLTQQELADKLGVTNKAVSKWERGDGLPDISLMTGLADILGITVDDLLRGEKRTDSASLSQAPLPAEEPPEEDAGSEAKVPLVPARFDNEEDTRVFEADTQVFEVGPTGGRQSEQAYDEAGEENWEGVPLYRRPWFILTVAAVAAVLLFVLAFLFWWGSRTAGEAESDSSSPSIPGWSDESTSASSTSVSSSSGTQEGTTEGTGHTIATTTTTTVQQTTSTTTTTVPSVPTTPKPPSNPEIPGSGIIPQAGHAILFNATENRVIYGYGYDERCYPASLTKLMTAIVALETCDEDTVFTVGEEILLVQEGSSTAYLQQGQQMKRDVLLHAMLLDSGGDAAYVLAAGIGHLLYGDPSLPAPDAVEAFCAQMNRKAQELGAVSSHFANPDGFHHANHYTTPMDILTISRYAYSLPEIRDIVSRSSIRDVFETGEDVTWKNSNRLLRQGDTYYYAGATGMKTGYTSEAGDCLVATAERNGMTLFAVVMDAPTDEARWTDAIALLDAGFAS